MEIAFGSFSSWVQRVAYNLTLRDSRGTSEGAPSTRRGGVSLKLRARPVDDEKVNRFIRHALERPMAVKGFEKAHFIHGNPYTHGSPWVTMVTTIQLRPDLKPPLDEFKEEKGSPWGVHRSPEREMHIL